MRFNSKYIVVPVAVFFLTACTSITASMPTPTPELVYLNDLQPSSTSIGFSELGRGVNPFTESPLVTGKPITVRATTYPEGLFAHAPSQIDYKLNGEYSSLSGYVLMHDGIECGDGAKFHIVADSREVFTSPVLTYNSDPAAFEVDLTGVQALILKIDSLSDMECDWSIWGDPVLTKEYRKIASIESIFTPTVQPTNTFPPTATFTPTATPTPAPTNHPGWMPEGAIARFGMGVYNAMSVSPDNSIVAIAGTSGVHFIDPMTSVITNFLETGANAEDAAFSPDGTRIYIGLGVQGVSVWIRDEMNSWKQEEILPVPCAAQVEISPNNDILFTKCWENAKNSKFIAWDIETKSQRYQINYAQPKTSFAMAFSPVDPDLMAVSANYTVTLMDVKGGRTISTYYEPNKNKVVDLDFSPDGSVLAITPESQEVILVDVESNEESGRIKHSSNVLQLSFIDHKTIAAFMKDYFVVESLDGKVLKKLNHPLNRAHIYAPMHKAIVMGNGGNVTVVSLDMGKVTGKVEGFNLYSQYADSISGNGNTVLKSNAVIHADHPTEFNWIDSYKICGDPKFSRFMDNDGKYILFYCGKDKLVTVETSTMKVVSSYKYPYTYTSNAFAAKHPWADERELLALMYKNTETSYRIEMWNPIQDKKISTMTVEMPESDWYPSMLISPHSKYLVVMTSDGKNIQSYDINTGNLVQNIELKTPRPLSNWVEEGIFFDDDAVFFIRHSNFVEAYSIESGEFLQKISGLNLLQGNSCATFCLEDPNNFTYFSKTKTFVVYNDVSNKNNIDLSFTSYDMETGQKTGTTSIQMPYQLQNGEEVDKRKLSLSIDYVYLPPEKNGNIVVVKVNLHDWDTTVHDSTIYTVDIPANMVLKSYTWQHTSWASKSFAFGNVFFFDGRPEPISFLFDISTP